MDLAFFTTQVLPKLHFGMATYPADVKDFEE